MTPSLLRRPLSAARHWDRDLIIGKANRSAVATLTERASRQTLTVALPHGYNAHRSADAVAAALARQPRHLVKTLTWDQGRELARWPDLSAALASRSTSATRPRHSSAPPTTKPTAC